MIISTLAAMTAGFVLNLFFGTPKILKADRYIIKLCEKLAPWISEKYQESVSGQHTAGVVYITLLLLILLVPLLIITILLYIFVPALAIIFDAIICWSVFDVKSLTEYAKSVARSVKTHNLIRACKNTQRLCGTDCSELDEGEMVKAAVEGISDRTVDRAAAPLLCMFILSGVGGVFFKAVDTAANLEYGDEEAALSFADPIRSLQNGLCLLPGKLTSMIMLVDALFLKLNTRSAERIYKRDKKKCIRTCFGGCRAVMAGLLGISLLPEEIYSEQLVRTLTIGEQLKDPEPSDIGTANSVMLGTTFIIMALCFMVKLTIGVWF